MGTENWQAPAVDVVDLPADMFHYSPERTMTPRLIVMHATAGTDSRLWLTRTSDPPVSVHRLIDRAGTIYKIVPDERVAWHVGNAILFPGPRGPLMNANRLALGIELENLNDGKQGYTDAQYESSARQVLEWWSRFGYLPIVRHSDIDARKTDPKGFGWDAFAYRLLAHRV